jgi:hypothetical protein
MLLQLEVFIVCTVDRSKYLYKVTDWEFFIKKFNYGFFLVRLLIK